MKKILVLMLIIAMATFTFVGCGGNDTPPPAPPAPPISDEPNNGLYDEPGDEPGDEPAGADFTFVGTWLWMGMEYYVFNADGTGTMADEAILWTAENGVLSICVTPDACNSLAACPAPMEWGYEFDGTELHLQSLLIDEMAFTYTRQ